MADDIGTQVRSIIERDMQKLRERDRQAQTSLTDAEKKDLATVGGRIDKAVALGYLAPAVAANYKEELDGFKKADELDRREFRDISNGLENPLERGKRYKTMDEYNEAVHDRAEAVRSKTGESSPMRHSMSRTDGGDGLER